jgi:DNA-binding MurR/RpiR family transcriptional regulator
MVGQPLGKSAMPADLPPRAAPPASVEAFHARLSALPADLPRRMRQCADHLAAQADRIAVSTVAEMAAGAGVPPSAMMRFCQGLGFQGYSDMQRLFREAFAPAFPDYATRLENLRRSPGGSPAALLGEFVEAGRASLEGLAKNHDSKALERASEVLARAGTIHLIGLKRAFSVAIYLGYVLEQLGMAAMLHDGTGRLDRSAALRPDDALVAISFAPYSEDTVALARTARARGLPVVALTDRPSSPLAALASEVIYVQEVDFGAFRALSATLAVVLTLAVAAGARRDSGAGGV